ncbi:MAG: hypothetical protein ISS15_00630 [Alphaproteobacteria bacterium]|nr:hypothetical protein [Alphaproteobacteria bacterium]MBL7096135.1 hypothetical protein [Alphaproteobacteria bacterium]
MPTDEIQVYTSDIEPVGVVGLTWHNNYTSDGPKIPDYPGALVDRHAYSSVTEWAYGVTPWFEAGLYVPLFANTPGQGWTFNGFKLRALFAKPGYADNEFYYGANFEFSWNQKWWKPHVNSIEIRPIIGFRFGPGNRLSITFNPILDSDYRGGIGGFEFNPATRLDYRIDDTWTAALEEYDGFGALHRFLPSSEQSHELWLAGDYNGDPISVEFGAGIGLTPASDGLTVKLMFSTDLTGPRGLLATR